MCQVAYKQPYEPFHLDSKQNTNIFSRRSNFEPFLSKNEFQPVSNKAQFNQALVKDTLRRNKLLFRNFDFVRMSNPALTKF